MSGHNKWSKIKNKKAVTDGQKSKIFGKLVRFIAVESKKAKGDVNAPGLRAAIEKAREANVPAYLVFSDATLLELATYLPQNSQELSMISGFGQVKLKLYGEIFLKAVVDFCEAHQLKSRMENKPRKPSKRRLSRLPNG